MTRVITFFGTAALAAVVLFRSAPDDRVLVRVIVSGAAVTLAIRSLLTGKIMYALLFLGILGIFTPFRSSQFSPALVSILGLATLAIFAASPMMLRKSRTPAVTSGPLEKL